MALSVGGVPVTRTTTIAGDVPEARLNIKAEREKLHTHIDAEDKLRWRERIREKHRLERVKAKETRIEEMAKRGVVAPTLEFEGEDAGDELFDAEKVRISNISQ